jgi:transcription elongation factor Elf1
LSKPRPQREFVDTGIPNIFEVGTKVKRKVHCYYCNNKCSNNLVKKEGNKERPICDVCDSGTRL